MRLVAGPRCSPNDDASLDDERVAQTVLLPTVVGVAASSLDDRANVANLLQTS